MFTAPSGAGKTSIAKKVLEFYPDFVFSVSATTRAKRPNEIDGKDYIFLSETEFKSKIDNDEFVEWENFYGYYYGTLKEFINSKLKENKSVVLDVDVKGAENIVESYNESAIVIFIMPPSKEELKERLKGRNTENAEDLNKRISRAEMELEYSDKFQYKVVNDNFEDAVEEVKNIINNELSKE